MRIGIVIPTRLQRPEFLKFCLMQLDRQTVQPNDICIVDEPAKNDKPDIHYRYMKGYNKLKKKCDIIFFWEEDDYYRPDYIETVIKHWKGEPLIGFDNTLYYNLLTQGYEYMPTPAHSSMFCTAMAGNLNFPETDTTFVDVLLWKTFTGKLLPLKNYCVGIKHGQGLIVSKGHSMKLKMQDNNLQYLGHLTGWPLQEQAMQFYSAQRLRLITSLTHGKKKVVMYQILYKDNIPKLDVSRNITGIDPGCVHEDTRHIPESTVSPIYENYHILRLYPKFTDADYYGTTSWRMFEKTGLTKKDIDRFVNENPANAYVYYQCSGGLKNAVQNEINHLTNIGKGVKRIIELGVFKSPDVIDKWVDVYANYFIADRQTWDRYIPVLKKVLELCKSDNTLKRILSNTFRFRNRDFPLTCFVLEYMFGLFLGDNPDIIWKQIPMFQNIGASLPTIYEKHKAPYGWGDKGTAHRYLRTYEALISQFRNRRITILEIGVCHGHSLRMWREYLPLARVIGIDIQKPSLDITGCEFHICDQTDVTKLSKIFKDTYFDVIIDDGSHFLQHQLASFKALFPRMNKGGIYIIEDVGGQSKEPEKDIAVLQKQLGECDVYDTRKESGQYDDILCVWVSNGLHKPV